ncbi:MAG: hypothetical protein IJO40_11080 [Thermoguttaceae bacterium]|nr:hypothetical protein [Thermoguttaceae bacterium]
MRPFEPKNSFGWTFFVLILASFWNGAAVKFDASSSSAPAVASRSTAENSSSPFDSVAQTLDSESADVLRDLSEPTSTFCETSLLGAPRRVQDSTRRRLGGDDFSSLASSAKSPSVRAFSFSASGLSSAVFRSFWDCQSASRPLFLTLRSLRN